MDYKSFFIHLYYLLGLVVAIGTPSE